MVGFASLVFRIARLPAQRRGATVHPKRDAVDIANRRLPSRLRLRGRIRL